MNLCRLLGRELAEVWCLKETVHQRDLKVLLCLSEALMTISSSTTKRSEEVL